MSPGVTCSLYPLCLRAMESTRGWAHSKTLPRQFAGHDEKVRWDFLSRRVEYHLRTSTSRQVLECARPLALWRRARGSNRPGSWSQYALNERRGSP